MSLGLSLEERPMAIKQSDTDKKLTGATSGYNKELIMQLSNFKDVVEKAAETLSPAQVANYVYDLVKTYNSFYQNNPVMTLEDENAKQFKLQISDLTAKTIKKSLHLLGINVVNRM